MVICQVYVFIHFTISAIKKFAEVVDRKLDSYLFMLMPYFETVKNCFVLTCLVLRHFFYFKSCRFFCQKIYTYIYYIF